MVRALLLHRRGRRFESCSAHTETPRDGGFWIKKNKLTGGVGAWVRGELGSKGAWEEGCLGAWALRVLLPISDDRAHRGMS